ncbi:MAG: RNA-binding S4 domain-containing protein [Vicingus serpentipes]|nr:RNA-binding S4 domain-containing protein [Vicingus serpentipes]
MEIIEFQLTKEYIELIKLLKLLGVSESGAEAKLMVEEGSVYCNNETEYRKRKKLRKGDLISIPNQKTQVKIV